MSRGSRLMGRRDVLWTVCAFVVLQLLFLSVVDLSRPELFDPEGGVRLQLAKRATREHPERPLLLVVGSSRIGLGFTPATLPPLRTPDGREVIVFNFAHLGAGPRMNLMQVRRALDYGLQPEWIVLEIVPGGLGHEGTQASMAAAGDLPALLRWTNAGRVWRDYLRNRLNPFYKHRQNFLRLVAPTFVTKATYNDLVTLDPLGDDTRWMRVEDHGVEGRKKQTEMARSIYEQRLQTLPIDPLLDGANRELLGLCRERGIKVVLLLTPEDSVFRSWYGTVAQHRLRNYLADLESQYGVACVDARDWVKDRHFCDPHHLKQTGASVFTARLGREVLQDLVSGNQPSGPPTQLAGPTR